MTEKKESKFGMDFVGYASMGSVKVVEANLVLSPDYDIKGVVSSFTSGDGSRLITLILRPTDKKLGRTGYSLQEEWHEELPLNSQQTNSEKLKKKS
jgi:hypothetical protein